MTIRKMREGDAAAVASLASQLGYPSSADDMRKRLVPILQDPAHALLVGESDGGVAGWIHLFVARYLESDPFVEIGGLVVDERDRRQGVGKTLVRAGERWAIEEKGLLTMRVRTNILRKESHPFYRELGYEEVKRQAVYTKVLEGPGALGSRLA